MSFRLSYSCSCSANPLLPLGIKPSRELTASPARSAALDTAEEIHSRSLMCFKGLQNIHFIFKENGAD